MDSIFTAVFEIIFNYVLSYPGALVRWIFTKGKTFKEVYDDSSYGNGIIGFIVILILVSIVIVINNNNEKRNKGGVKEQDIELIITKTDDKIDSVETLYKLAITNIESGMMDSSLHLNYLQEISSLRESINADLIELSEICMALGKSENEYQQIVNEIDNQDVSNLHSRLLEFGVTF